VHMEIAFAISKARISIVTTGGGPRFTLHMSAVAVSAFNRDVQFALRPNRFRFSGKPSLLPQYSYRSMLLEVSDKLKKAVVKLQKIAFVQFSREQSEIMILYSIQVIIDKK